MFRFSQQLVVSSFILFAIEAAIIELNDENFHSEICNHNLSLIVFHTSWCDQCNSLLLKLPQIDEKLREISPYINIFTIECDLDGKSICEKYQIGGFPILKSFRLGEEYGTFEGNREVNSVIKFMKVEAAPVAKYLEDFNYIEKKLVEENRVCLVASFRKRSKLEVIFIALAEKLRRNICFLYSFNENENPWVKLYRDPKLWNIFEDVFVQYEGEEDIKKLEEFVTKTYHGLVAIRTFSNKNEFESPLVTVYFNIDYNMNPKGSKYWHNRILKVAFNYRKYFNFAMSSKNEFHDELRDLGVNDFGDEKPIVVVVLETAEKFVLKQNFSVESFDLFLHNILHKLLNPYLKSQEVPENSSSRVVTAVGSTFYDLAINHANDTMVKIYADWCSYCKKIRPVFEELADRMQDEKITFVEIDATQNDLPVAYSSDGFPTFYLSTSKNRMNPVRYQGDRSMEDFIKFIARHASFELNNYDRNGAPKSRKTEL